MRPLDYCQVRRALEQPPLLPHHSNDESADNGLTSFRNRGIFSLISFENQDTSHPYHSLLVSAGSWQLTVEVHL